MAPDERLPGITFHLEESSLGPSSVHKGNGKITLQADVDDIDMWDKVVHHFSELRIYDAGDFKTELIELMQDDNKRLTDQMEQFAHNTKSNEEQLLQRTSFAESENAKLTLENKKKDAQIDVLNQELETLRDFKRQLDELAQATNSTS
jgi:hypothetical protein